MVVGRALSDGRRDEDAEPGESRFVSLPLTFRFSHAFLVLEKPFN